MNHKRFIHPHILTTEQNLRHFFFCNNQCTFQKVYVCILIKIKKLNTSYYYFRITPAISVHR